MACFLIDHGVPFDVAFSMSNPMRLAFYVVFGEMSGPQRYDWESGTWADKT